LPIKINVPYNQKDRVKSLGAKWDPQEKTWYIPNHITDLKSFEPYLNFTLDNAEYIFNPDESYFILGHVYCHKCHHKNLCGIFASSDFKKRDKNTYIRCKNLTIFDGICDFSNYDSSHVINWMCSLTNCFYEDDIFFIEYKNYCPHCKTEMAEYESIADEYSPFYIHRLIDNFKKGYLIFYKCPFKFDFRLYCHPADSLIDPFLTSKATRYLNVLLKKKNKFT